jgi:hypothetical protein
VAGKAGDVIVIVGSGGGWAWAKILVVGERGERKVEIGGVDEVVAVVPLTCAVAAGWMTTAG